MKKMSLAAVAVAVLFVAIPDASARSARVNQVPNGLENSCQTCHTVALPQVGNGPLNDFGMDVEQNLTGGGAVSSQDVDWAAVCDLDSDGDGFTNGEELGDPDCTWTQGDNPGEYQSKPGDASSMPAEEGGDAGGGDVGADAGDNDAGGTGDTGVGDDAGGADTGDDSMDAGGGSDTGMSGDDSGGGSDDEGCSTVSADAPVSAGLALLGFVLLGAWRRRR